MRTCIHILTAHLCLAAPSAIEGPAAPSAPATTPAFGITMSSAALFAQWSLDSRAASDGEGLDTLAGAVDYRIEPSWVRTFAATANWHEVRLSIAAADRFDVDAADTYVNLLGAIDYLFGEQRWLRLVYEAGELHGQAVFQRQDGYRREAAVETTWKRFGCSYGEGPWLIGASYEDLTVPLAVGFVGPSKAIVYSDFMPEARWQLYQVMGGFDHGQLLAERGGNYVGPTGGCQLGLGYGHFTVPRSIIAAAETATGLDSDDDASGFALSLDAHLGFALQGDLGWASGMIAIGARGRWMYTTTAPIGDDTNSPDPGSMWLRIQYRQLMWGPYLAASLSF